MGEQTNPKPVALEQEPARQPYTQPRLVRHGTIADLTAGGLPVGRPGDLVSDSP
jgi:hypothetical protein